MARRVAFAVAGLFVTVAEAKSCDAETLALRKQLEEATNELGTLRAARPALSVLGAVSSASQMVSEAAQQLLDSTDVDDKVITAVSNKYAVAREMSADAYSKVANADYSSYMKAAQGHYDTHLAIHVNTASKTLKPHMDNYVYPTIEKAGVHLEPVVEQAKGHYTTAANSLQTQVFPTLQARIAEAPKHLEKAQTVASTLLDSVFDTFAKVAPKHLELFPKHPVDRALLLIVSAFALFELFFLAQWFAKIGFSVFLGVFKLSWAVLWGFTSRVLSWTIFLGTGFYCCCLCRRRGGAKKLKGKADKATKAAQGGSAKKEATVKELVAMLETFKKDKKLAPAAKQLVELAKSGKSMNTPKELSGKTVTKDTVKQALQKFKEIDLKKVGL